jgi:streptothricin hydrolase
MGQEQPPIGALLVVDVQAAFVDGAGAVPGAEPLRAVITRLVDRARSAGAVLVHLQNDGPPGAVDEPGSPGWRLWLPARPGPDELVLRKDSDDGFAGTGLAAELAARGVGGVAVCGVQSEMCVAATARSALAAGLRVVLPHDAHATYDIPAVPGMADAVPAAAVSRVAEWSLGDGLDLVPTADGVTFAAHRRYHV